LLAVTAVFVCFLCSIKRYNYLV